MSRVNLSDADVERLGLGNDRRPRLFEVVLSEGNQPFFDEVVTRLSGYMDVLLVVLAGPVSISSPFDRRLVEIAMDALASLGSDVALGLVDVGTRMWRPGTNGVGFFLVHYACGKRGLVHLKGTTPGSPVLLMPSAALAVTNAMLDDGSVEAWINARYMASLPEVEAVREGGA